VTYQFSQVNVASTQGDKPAVDRVQQGADLVDFQLIKKTDPTEGSLLPIGVPTNPESVKQVMEGKDFANGVLADGAAVEVLMAGCPLNAMVWVDPVAGDTVTVTYKPSINAVARAFPIGANGVVDASAEVRLTANIYALYFQRTGGVGTTSQYGVTK